MPWARVKITPLGADSRLDPVEGITPLSVTLPEGEYRLEYGDGREATPYWQTFRVRPDEVNGVRLERPDIDVDSIVDQILDSQ